MILHSYVCRHLPCFPRDAVTQLARKKIFFLWTQESLLPLPTHLVWWLHHLLVHTRLLLPVARRESGREETPLNGPSYSMSDARKSRVTDAGIKRTSWRGDVKHPHYKQFHRPKEEQVESISFSFCVFCCLMNCTVSSALVMVMVMPASRDPWLCVSRALADKSWASVATILSLSPSPSLSLSRFRDANVTFSPLILFQLISPECRSQWVRDTCWLKLCHQMLNSHFARRMKRTREWTEGWKNRGRRRKKRFLPFCILLFFFFRLFSLSIVASSVHFLAPWVLLFLLQFCLHLTFSPACARVFTRDQAILPHMQLLFFFFFFSSSLFLCKHWIRLRDSFPLSPSHTSFMRAYLCLKYRAILFTLRIHPQSKLVAAKCVK